MTIVHQVSDELLLEYATGSLSEGWCIAVASHLALSPEGRRRLAAIEAAGGALLKDIPVAEEDTDDSWSRMKARLSEAGGVAINVPMPARRVEATEAILPEPLRSYLGADVDALKWKALGRGAYHIKIPTGDPTTSVRLLKIPAGKPVPEHGHGGRELTLVLKGSFSDGDDSFGRGDLEEADEDLQHQPVAGKDEDCICLAVTDAPLKFKSPLVRLVQPILGI
ncbi:ChrR family anti-sigma-E factor [Ciceribacter sp. L1K22]|uniref:ChrR family anti-sigma-E factor n=1 Tax=Ciceribacter sp. L1K22 TaxID=2820275 RepID=UPI001ABDBD09|nr:ChrR family anti-sigma-E factor [Ciceribacter sp. L1K22]MBO3762148.1 cupin domain-containing protein [Ciceribacter sp. L1K22]